MSPTSLLTQDGLPPLLALPMEMKLQIISYLPHDKSPNLACLRRTHKSFRVIIPKSDIRSKSPPIILHRQLLDTELNHSYLLPLDHYPCYRCTAVLPSQNFHPWMVQCNFIIGGAHAYNRFCYRCGFRPASSSEEHWEREGQKQVALQPHPVERQPFYPLDLQLGMVGIPQVFLGDYINEDLMPRFISKYCVTDCGMGLEDCNRAPGVVLGD